MVDPPVTDRLGIVDHTGKDGKAVVVRYALVILTDANSTESYRSAVLTAVVHTPQGALCAQ
jgi:hypothetical protein